MSTDQPTGQIPDDAGLTPRVCPHHFDCDGVRCDPSVSDVPSSAPARVELEDDERATPAPVGAAVALDLDAFEAAALADDGWWSVPVLALVAEVRSLRAKVAALQVAVSHSAESCADGPCEFHETEFRAESAEAKVAAVEALAERWQARDSSDFRSGPIRAALATGEGKHVAIEVFTAEGIPFVRCSCSTATGPTSHRWLTEHVPNGGVPELQAVVKRQAEGAKA